MSIAEIKLKIIELKNELSMLCDEDYYRQCDLIEQYEIKLDRAGLEYEICDDVNEMKARGLKAAPVLETDEGVFNFSEAIKWVNKQK